jgi:hypothetical protein
MALLFGLAIVTNDFDGINVQIISHLHNCFWGLTCDTVLIELFGCSNSNSNKKIPQLPEAITLKMTKKEMKKPLH